MEIIYVLLMVLVSFVFVALFIPVVKKMAEFIGAMDILGNKESYSSTLQASTDSMIIVIPKIDFINWLFTSDTGKAYVSGDLGFIAPFDTFNDDEKPEDPLSKEVINWMSKDNINTVPWVFQAFPSQNFKDTFASALLEYVQGTQDWNYVVNTVKDSWKAEKAQ